MKKLSPPARMELSLPGGHGAPRNVGFSDTAICQVLYAMHWGD